MKRCLTSLVNRKMQITITIRCHFISTRMAIKDKTDNNVGKDVKIETLTYHCWECKMVQPLGQTV